MRTLQRNKKALKYSNLISKGCKHITDAEGNLLETGEPEYVYDFPIDFKASLTMSRSGYAEAVEFGLNLTDYNAVMVVPKNSLPIKEGSLIWDKTEPRTDNQGYAIKSSADYTVIKVSSTVNVDKFILKRLVNGQ